MATAHEIQIALSGFSHQLTWAGFPNVASSPSPPLLALTSSSYRMGPWRVVLEKGAYRVHGTRVTVSFNGAASWATPAARTDAALLLHEQGHYDITGLIARDLAVSLIDLEISAAVIAAMKGSGTNSSQHMRYAQQQLQKSVDDYGRQAASLLAKLQSNPTTGADGIYDTQTSHGVTVAAQTTWNDRLARAKKTDENFGLSLAMAGVV